MRTLTIVLSLCGIFAVGQERAAASTIVWHVENPFRFFPNPTATELHRGANASGGSVLTTERSLAARHRYGWAESIFLETCWHLIRQDHSACGGLDAYVNPRSHRISARLVGGGRNTAMCDWHFEALSGQQLSWRSKSTPCGDPISVDVPYPTIAVERDGLSVCEGGNSAGLDGFTAFLLDRRRIAEAEAVAAELNERLALIARKYGWSFVSQHRPRFAGRGICAGQEDRSSTGHDELLLPRWTGRAWSPYRPSAYEPYAPRKRWIRTSNDAYMTAHVDLSSDLRRQARGDGRYQPTDLLRASTFGGAFHPTAEGQAAIADAVLDRTRRIVRQSGAH